MDSKPDDLATSFPDSPIPRPESSRLDAQLRERFLAAAIQSLRGEKAVRVAPKIPRSLGLQAFRRLAIGLDETLLAVVTVPNHLAAFTSRGVRQFTPFDPRDPSADVSGLDLVTFVPYEALTIDESETGPIIRLSESQSFRVSDVAPIFSVSTFSRDVRDHDPDAQLNLTKLGPSEQKSIRRFLTAASRVQRLESVPSPSPVEAEQARKDWEKITAYSHSIRELDLGAREFFIRFAPARGRWGAPAVYLIALVCVLVFIGCWGWGLDDVLERGAQFAPAMVGDGEWWRIGTAMFLHANLIHVIFNMIALVLVGRIVERVYGTYYFLWIYFLSGVGGSLASLGTTWSEIAASVGASGAIMGLFGALAAYLVRRRDVVPRAIIREFGFWILNCLGLTLGLGLALSWSEVARVDNSAHLGGLGMGFIAGWLASPSAPYSWLRLSPTERQSAQRRSMIARTAGMLIVAALLTGTAVAFARALSADSEFQSRRFLLKAEALRVELERSFEESERLAKALSVAMKRSIMGATSFAGSGAGIPLSRPMASA